MYKNIIFGIGILVFIVACSNKNLQNNSKNTIFAKNGDPVKLYSELCASCHGEKVQAFVDRKWKNGNSIAELQKSISNGYIDDGMPSWKESLSEDQILSLATLINKNLETLDQYKFDEKPKSNIFKDQSVSVKLDTVATGIESPWGLAQLPNLDYLITDKSGILYLVDQKRNKKEVAGLPKITAKGQGGLMDIVLHPNFNKNNLVYFSYTKAKEDNEDMLTTAIAMAEYKNLKLHNVKEIFVALPFSSKTQHFGSRIIFDNQNYIYFSVGDRGNRDENPQNLDNHCGKIHRLNDDGSIPKDNPFVSLNNEFSTIYSYGHRNPQGLTYDSKTDTIWETEHGPRGGDEVNIIKKGKNYGWPLVSYGINYNGTTFTSITEKEEMEQPEIYWIPSIAPCGLAFVNSDIYGNWKGDILAGSLRFNYVNRCQIKDGKVVKEEKLMANIGRTRNVIQGKDGYLYVSTERPGNVFKLIPN